eukprot:TRINITY_DN3665_c0_g1_i1.p1 TRINITY_DN3665_c0_g1~~TRINITY_DN3665_c0_g1_i1.p1  ORF type:complete len:116 (+),score=12.37 TRINITY_DN3665_c0_g1_i1:115-462(+)
MHVKPHKPRKISPACSLVTLFFLRGFLCEVAPIARNDLHEAVALGYVAVVFEHGVVKHPRPHHVTIAVAVQVPRESHLGGDLRVQHFLKGLGPCQRKTALPKYSHYIQKNRRVDR